MSTSVAYVLLPYRSLDAVERFLNHFLPSRKLAADELEYPQNSDTPSLAHLDERQLIRRLEIDDTAVYALYWNSTDIDRAVRIYQAMVFFTKDGEMLLGVAIPEECALDATKELQQVLIAQWGLVTGDECPPDSGEEFRDNCRSATLPSIVNGILHA